MAISSQRGFGLIEILITLLVFSIGILAVAGLQAISKKNNFDALQRTEAANLAGFIVSSMRSNPAALADYLVSQGSPRGSRDQVSAPEKDCYQADCSPGELAAFDLWQWEKALDGAGETVTADGETTPTGGLSRASACITGPAGGGSGFYTIVIAWRGVTQLDTGGVNACGTGRGLYGAPSDTTGGAADESYQRALVLETFIAS